MNSAELHLWNTRVTKNPPVYFSLYVFPLCVAYLFFPGRNEITRLEIKLHFWPWPNRHGSHCISIAPPTPLQQAYRFPLAPAPNDWLIAFQYFLSSEGGAFLHPDFFLGRVLVLEPYSTFKPFFQPPVFLPWQTDSWARGRGTALQLSGSWSKHHGRLFS